MWVDHGALLFIACIVSVQSRALQYTHKKVLKNGEFLNYVRMILSRIYPLFFKKQSTEYCWQLVLLSTLPWQESLLGYSLGWGGATETRILRMLSMVASGSPPRPDPRPLWCLLTRWCKDLLQLRNSSGWSESLLSSVVCCTRMSSGGVHIQQGWGRTGYCGTLPRNGA